MASKAIFYPDFLPATARSYFARSTLVLRCFRGICTLIWGFSPVTGANVLFFGAQLWPL
jgi:hypothetical protein